MARRSTSGGYWRGDASARTAIRPAEGRNAEVIRYDPQRVGAEAAAADPHDPAVGDLQAMDLVQALDAVERAVANDHRLALVLYDLPPGVLAEAERGHDHVRVAEERLALFEAVHLGAADHVDA